MSEITVIAALAFGVFCCVAYGCWDADLRARFADTEHDWRDEWCCLECWAPDGQDGPCRDCAGRRR